MNHMDIKGGAMKLLYQKVQLFSDYDDSYQLFNTSLFNTYYLQEYMWRKQFAKGGEDPFMNIVGHNIITEVCPI